MSKNIAVSHLSPNHKNVTVENLANVAMFPQTFMATLDDGQKEAVRRFARGVLKALQFGDNSPGKSLNTANDAMLLGLLSMTAGLDSGAFYGVTPFQLHFRHASGTDVMPYLQALLDQDMDKPAKIALLKTALQGKQDLTSEALTFIRNHSSLTTEDLAKLGIKPSASVLAVQQAKAEAQAIAKQKDSEIEILKKEMAKRDAQMSALLKKLGVEVEPTEKPKVTRKAKTQDATTVTQPETPKQETAISAAMAKKNAKTQAIIAKAHAAKK